MIPVPRLMDLQTGFLQTNPRELCPCSILMVKIIINIQYLRITHMRIFTSLNSWHARHTNTINTMRKSTNVNSVYNLYTSIMRTCYDKRSMRLRRMERGAHFLHSFAPATCAETRLLHRMEWSEHLRH
jgi:hypothetical protein